MTAESSRSRGNATALGSAPALQQPALGEWSWLVRVLCPDTENVRPVCAKPYTVQIDGAPHLVATNGRIMVVVPGEHGAEQASDDITKSILGIIPSPSPAEATFAWHDLRGFLGVKVGSPCPACGGGGVLDKCTKCSGLGTYSCTCYECDDEHDADCSECDGVGSYLCGNCRIDSQSGVLRVRMGRGVFNKHLLVPLAYWLDASVVEWRTDKHGKGGFMRAIISAHNWTLHVMPLRDDGTHAGAKVFSPLAVAREEKARGSAPERAS